MRYLLITLLVTNLLLSSSFAGTTQNSRTPSKAAEVTRNVAVPQRSDSSISNIADSTSIVSDTVRAFQRIDSVKVKAEREKFIQDSIELDKKESERKVVQDSLLNRVNQRHDIFDNNIPRTTKFYYNPFVHTQRQSFISDGTAASEVLALNPFGISVPFTLSSNLNRYLIYGNTAPITTVSFLDNPNLFPFSQEQGTDNQFNTEYSSLKLGIGPRLGSTINPPNLLVPEVLAYWENGVFDENIFNLRFTRPISRNLMVNVISNYRHFNASHYNHNTGDILSFYQSFTPDTASLSSSGYNPLTNEFTTGLQLNWYENGFSTYRGSIKYSDLTNELSTTVGGLEQFRELNQYRTEITLGVDKKRIGPMFLTTDIEFKDDDIINNIPLQTGRFNRRDANSTFFNANASPSVSILTKDTVSLNAGISYESKKLYTDSTWSQVLPRIEAAISIPFSQKKLSGSLHGSAGILGNYSTDSSRIAPVWRADAQFILNDQIARVYINQDALPYNMPLDSFVPPDLILDIYQTAGAELLLRKAGAGILIGYQFVNGVSDNTVRNVWPSGLIPYSQPRSTFILGTELGRWAGIGLSARTMISDVKPYIKAGGALSYEVHPATTRESFDAALTLDYWSIRDPITYAGYNRWNSEIINFGFHSAFQIRSFRLFYKVDNLLNRKFAYVPGYLMPGLTFRWGINWFIQG